MCCVLVYKKPDTLHYEIFMKLMHLVFIYKNHDNMRYLTILFTKSRNFAESKIVFIMFLNTKSLTLCVTYFFMEFLKLAEGRRNFFMQKNALWVKFYMQKNALCVAFLYTNSQTLCVTFLYAKNNAIWVGGVYI